MKIKIERTLKKPRNKIPRWFSSLTQKLRRRNNFAHFLTGNHLPIRELNSMRTLSNPATRTELELQQCNGLIYSNIAKFR